jgi:hypothetical protein
MAVKNPNQMAAHQEEYAYEVEEGPAIFQNMLHDCSSCL